MSFVPLSHSRLALFWRGIGWLLIFAVIVLSLLPRVPSPEFVHGDKIQHVLAYFGLMAWFAQIDREVATRFRWLGGLALMGIGLELLQGWMGFRMYDPLDMLANTTGVLLGWCLAPPRGPDVYGRVEMRLHRMAE
jgi:VanZ family protein